MAIKYLAGDRIQGTSAERVAATEFWGESVTEGVPAVDMKFHSDNYNEVKHGTYTGNDWAIDSNDRVDVTIGDSPSNTWHGTSMYSRIYLYNQTNSNVTLDTSAGDFKLGTGSLYFNGTNAKLSNDDIKDACFGTGSISFWFKANDTISNLDGKKIFSIGDTNANEYFNIAVESNDGGRIRAGLKISGTTQWDIHQDGVSSGGNLSTSGWNHIVVTHDGSVPKLYVNGTEDTNFSTQTDKTKWWDDLTGVDNGRIGCQNWDGDGDENFIKGWIDDFAIWNLALTSGNVSSLWGSGSSPQTAVTIPSGITCYYDCNSATVNDAISPLPSAIKGDSGNFTATFTIVNPGQYHQITFSMFVGNRSNGDVIFGKIADSHGAPGEYPRFGYSFDSLSTSQENDAGTFTTFRVKIQRVGDVWTISSPDGDADPVTITPPSQLLSQLVVYGTRILWSGNTAESSVTMNSFTNDFLFSPNMPNGTIFEESDTGKFWMWDGTSSWNEMI